MSAVSGIRRRLVCRRDGAARAGTHRTRPGRRSSARSNSARRGRRSRTRRSPAMRAMREDAGPHVKRGLSLQKQGDCRRGHRRIRGGDCDRLAAGPGAREPDRSLRPSGKTGRRPSRHYRALERIGAGARRGPLQLRHLSGGAAQERRGRRHVPEGAGRQSAATPVRSAALGQLAEVEGRVDEAEASYRKALAESPGDPMVRFNIGRMLIARRQYS